MIREKMICTGIAFLFLLVSVKGQVTKPPTSYGNVIPSGSLKKNYWQAENNSNEVQQVFSGLILFYKSFISSQDLTVCTFTPSCSEFGILAIKEHGLFKGGFLTMDRLTRCNGLSPLKYEFDFKQGLLIDDPRTYNETLPIVSKIK